MQVHFFNKDNQNGGLLLITVGLFILLFVTKVFQHGLFFDGLIYSSISSNLSEGLGSFWQPYFSETIYPQFYEHPPLVFGMEAFFMRLFNGSIYSEKLFSLLMALLSGYFIGLIWRKISLSERQKQLFWLPILFWILTPKNAWAFSNNLLENSLTMFTLASIYFLVVSINTKGLKHYASIALVAGLVFSAFLSKGFPGLFPFGFFFFYWLIFNSRYNLKSFLLDTVFLISCFLVIVIAVFYFNPAAQTNFLTYFDSQVMASITEENRVGSRLVLMKNLFNELLPILIISTVLIILFRKKIKTVFNTEGNYLKYGLFFLLIGLSASVPLMVSLKISSFYLIPALPYFDVAFAFILSAFVLLLIENLSGNRMSNIILITLGCITITTGFSLTILNYDTIGRDNEIINDMRLIEPIIGEREVISLAPSQYQDWTTISYFQRYLQVSFDRTKLERRYYLGLNGSIIQPKYSLILQGEKFSLYEKN